MIASSKKQLMLALRPVSHGGFDPADALRRAILPGHGRARGARPSRDGRKVVEESQEEVGVGRKVGSDVVVDVITRIIIV